MPSTREFLDLIAPTAKALGHGGRLELLELLSQRERGVNELAALSGLGVTTVSAHLQILKDAGLVVSQRDGTRVLYDLAGDDVARLMVALFDVAQHHRSELQLARHQSEQDGPELASEHDVETGVDTGDVVLLDVRPADEFDTWHLPHAINIPRDELSDRLDELPHGVTVVLYCRGRYCRMSYNAAEVLNQAGLTVKILPAGATDWRSRRGSNAA